MRTMEIPLLLRRQAAQQASGLVSFSSFTETWPTNAAALPAAWTVVPGSTTPQQLNIAGTGWYDANGGTNSAYRDAGGQKGIIELPLGGGSEGIFGNTWAFIAWAMDAARTKYNYVIARADTHFLQYNEWDGVSTTNSNSGTTSLISTWAGIRITLSNNGNYLIEINTGSGYTTEISGTQASNYNAAGQTYMMLSSAAGAPNALFGKVIVGP